MDFPKWQIHRGYWLDGVRENTFEAFQLAKEKGAEMVELDVQVSRDGVPFVYHDLDLQRIFHIDKKFKTLDSEELEALNIARLSKVLNDVKGLSAFNIELKNTSFFCRVFTRQICEEIEAVKEGKNLLISSFNPLCLYWAQKFLPDVPRALIVGDARRLMSFKFSLEMWLANPQYVNAFYELVDVEATRNELLSYEKPMMIWTVNDPEKAKFYLSRGARSIISDNPPPDLLD